TRRPPTANTLVTGWIALFVHAGRTKGRAVVGWVEALLTAGGGVPSSETVRAPTTAATRRATSTAPSAQCFRAIGTHPASAGQDRPRHQVGAEGGEDRQVQQAGRRH